MSLTAADKVEIQELVARYNRAIDSGDVEGWVDTFLPDGVFEGLVVPTFRGHDELRAFATAFWTEPEYAEWRGAQHWATNMIIDGEGDRATLFAYHIMFTPDGPGANPALLAAYDDELRKVDGRWKFARRRVIEFPGGQTG